MAPEAANAVSVSVNRRALLNTVPVRIAVSSFAIIVEFAVLFLITLITYFANSKLYFEVFDDSSDFYGRETTGFWIGVADSRKYWDANSFAALIDD